MFNSLLNKVNNFCALPISRKIQYLSHSYFRIKGAFLYRLLFKQFGRGSQLRSPLFVSYESVQIGKNVLIWDHARIEAIDSYGDRKFTPNIILGDEVTIQQRCHITAADELSIGSNCLISFDVMIQDTDHEYENILAPIAQQPLRVVKTTIGENCFIGSGAKINAGTTLGKHCIVGASSVVRGNFPDYCVIVGIPGKIIKKYNSETKQWQKTDSKGDFI